MPSDDPEKRICQKCTLENCKKCSGTRNHNECNMCSYYYFPIYKNDKIESCSSCEIGEGDKCATCKGFYGCATCNPGYVAVEGDCLPYYIKAEYETIQDNEKVYLIYNKYKNISMNIIFNDIKENITNNEYIFGKSGIHSITLLSPKVNSLVGLFENNEYLKSVSIINEGKIDSLENTFSGAKKLESANITNINTYFLKSVENIFKDCHSLKSVTFPKKFRVLNRLNGMFQNCHLLTSIDFSNVTLGPYSIYMNNAFENCSNLEYISFENSTINKLYNIFSMFRGCSSLTSVNMSNLVFNSRFGKITINYMFYDCPKLSLIDISSLQITNNLTQDILFNDLPPEGIISINKRVLKIINETIPSNWTIIEK